VVVINGAPGSGKITLATSFLKDNPAIKNRTRWISFDEENNDLFSFWFYFIETVKDLLGEQGEGIVSVFHGMVQKQDIERILIILINQLQYSGEIAILLDDFHHIRDEFLLETVTFFVKHSSDNVRLIILTREEPKLYMGDLLISGRLLEIVDEDLRLSHEERLEFLKNTLSYNLDRDTANRMANLSEGWVGGLQLLALAMNQKQPDLLRNAKALNKYMIDYLSNEILKSADEDVNDFLIKTSILSHFDKKLCNSLLGKNDSGGSYPRFTFNSQLVLIAVLRRCRYQQLIFLPGGFSDRYGTFQSRVDRQAGSRFRVTMSGIPSPRLPDIRGR
jgi:LuxR family transcriptional regulator, maltose regulon positive regulatory protein